MFDSSANQIHQGIVLQKPVLKHPTQRVGELGFIMRAQRSELQALSISEVGGEVDTVQPV